MSTITGGAQGNADCDTNISFSPDGLYVFFNTTGSAFDSLDTNGMFDVYKQSVTGGPPVRVSKTSCGGLCNGGTTIGSRRAIALSGTDYLVAFNSIATNIICGQTQTTVSQCYVRNLTSGVIEMVSVDNLGNPGNGNSVCSAISPDGRYVAFQSAATNFSIADTLSDYDIYLRDRVQQTTTLISVNTSGIKGNSGSLRPDLSIGCAGGEMGSSGDCVVVSFSSGADNLVSNDTNQRIDVFVRDPAANTTERVSVDSNGNQGNNNADEYSCLSADGTRVAFSSGATNLVSGDSNGASDSFIHDRSFGTTTRISLTSSNAEANGSSSLVWISTDGEVSAFTSLATNLINNDANGVQDVFARFDNSSGPTTICNPGSGGVRACPCANPPTSQGLGCNNSAATGGAALTASGHALLSSDNLSFTTSGELPTVTSIVFQGNSVAYNGIVYGQGVRCASGSLKRLYTKPAVSGSIIAPDFGAGDPSVSVRSAALGDTILPASSRWYMVDYRDPMILGGCPAGSTYNVTVTLQVLWGS